LTREVADRERERGRMEVKDRDAIHRAMVEAPRLMAMARYREAVGLLDQTAAGLSEFAPADDRARLERAVAEARLAEQLDSICLGSASGVGGQWTGADVAAPVYLEVFAHYGLRSFQEDVAALAERIRTSPAKDALLRALDEWASKEEDEKRRERLTHISRAA